MIKRILWDIVLVILVFAAPWWVILVVSLGGAVLFSWYVEMIFAAAIIDAIYGGVAHHWYAHLIHTGIFAISLCIVEFVKSKISLDA